jgi:hypothetical protein
MAGAGEACSHVAALAFAVDGYTRTREATTCTATPDYWKVPSMKVIAPKAGFEIDFSSAKKQKT